MIQNTCRGVALLVLGLLSSASFANTGALTKDTDLRSAPSLDASAKGKAAKQAKVDILSTKGGWVEIKTADGKTGWVRLMNVEPADAKSSGSALKGLATAGNVVRTGSTGSTAATGVKGISKEDLAAAKPNFNEVELLERYRATPADGEQHARTAGLKAQNVSTLPAD